MLVKFRINWIQKIHLTAKLDSANGLVQFWLSSEFFSHNYFQIGQHVVLLHIPMTVSGLVHAGERLRNVWTIDRAATDWTLWPYDSLPARIKGVFSLVGENINTTLFIIISFVFG